MTYSDINAIGELKSSTDVKVRSNPGLKDCTSPSNTWDNKAQNRQGSQSNLKRSRSFWSCKQLKVCSYASCWQLNEAATDYTCDLLAIVTSLEDIRNEIDLTWIDLESSLCKSYLSPSRAVLASDLNGQLRYWYKLLQTKEEAFRRKYSIDELRLEVEDSGIDRVGRVSWDGDIKGLSLLPYLRRVATEEVIVSGVTEWDVEAIECILPRFFADWELEYFAFVRELDVVYPRDVSKDSAPMTSTTYLYTARSPSLLQLSCDVTTNPPLFSWHA
jgi:hypothetical protein